MILDKIGVMDMGQKSAWEWGEATLDAGQRSTEPEQ